MLEASITQQGCITPPYTPPSPSPGKLFNILCVTTFEGVPNTLATSSSQETCIKFHGTL